MKTQKPRSLAFEATVFWLIVGGVITAYLAASITGNGSLTGLEYFVPTLVIAALYFGLAYACWKMIRGGFLLSIISALVATVVFSGILYSAIGGILVILQLQIVFFSYRAYAEMKTERTSAQ